METLVNQQNFYLGCRVCLQLLAKNSVGVCFFDAVPDFELKYSDAFYECTNLQVTQTDGLPKRLCSDCAAKLTIAYQFKRDALESSKVLKSYSDMEKSENEMYENGMKFDDDEYFEYETLEETDDNSQDSKKGHFEEVTVVPGGSDAVSFLAGILKPTGEDKMKTIEIKKVTPKRLTDAGFDDPSRKHICNVCSKKFQKRSNLIDHLRLHANVKVFSCEYCEKSFVQAGNYKAHIRTHTKEKPYSCHYCNKAYSQSSSLKIHIRSHTQEKNYICDVCEKAFTNASDLGKHKLIHDPVKKFRCEECNRHFTQKIHLRKHLEKHHPEIDFDLTYAARDQEQTIIKVEGVKMEQLSDGSKVIYEEYELEDEPEEEIEIPAK